MGVAPKVWPVGVVLSSCLLKSNQDALIHQIFSVSHFCSQFKRSKSTLLHLHYLVFTLVLQLYASAQQKTKSLGVSHLSRGKQEKKGQLCWGAVVLFLGVSSSDIPFHLLRFWWIPSPPHGPPSSLWIQRQAQSLITGPTMMLKCFCSAYAGNKDAFVLCY